MFKFAFKRIAQKLDIKRQYVLQKTSVNFQKRQLGLIKQNTQEIIREREKNLSPISVQILLKKIAPWMLDFPAISEFFFLSIPKKFT